MEEEEEDDDKSDDVNDVIEKEEGCFEGLVLWDELISNENEVLEEGVSDDGVYKVVLKVYFVSLFRYCYILVLIVI